MDLFKDCIPSILQTKDYQLSSETEEREYAPYLVNKALSQHIDCLYHANLMNQNYHLDNKLQYDYLFHSVKGYKRRYQKWFKNQDTKEMELVKEYYQCSSAKSKTILSVLTKDQLKYIEKKLDKGGRVANNK